MSDPAMQVWKDGLHRPVPSRLAGAFRLRSDVLQPVRMLAEFADRLLSLMRWGGIDDPRVEELRKTMQDWHRDVTGLLPFVPCPCPGGCAVCKGKGWLSIDEIQAEYERLQAQPSLAEWFASVPVDTLEASPCAAPT